MIYALDSVGEIVAASPGEVGTCRHCGGSMQARCGKLVSWHWAHRRGESCDPWSEAETQWHLDWKSRLESAGCSIEVTRGTHRADAVTPAGWVLEVQHSSISVDEIREREEHYGDCMAWVFDCRDAFRLGRLEVRPKKGGEYHSFAWKQPRKSLIAVRRPLVLDIGSDVLFSVRKISGFGESESAAGFRRLSGWGHLLPVSRWLDDLRVGWTFVRRSIAQLPRTEEQRELDRWDDLEARLWGSGDPA